MNYYVFYGFISLLLLICLAGVGMAEEAPGSVVYVQGGVSSITEGADGEMIITVQDIIPYFHLPNGNESFLMPVEFLSVDAYPLNAAVVFSGADDESVSLVIISNLSLSDDNTVLTLHVIPQEFYEGEVLKSFTHESKDLDITTTPTRYNTGIYIEKTSLPATNSDYACEACIDRCIQGKGCIKEGNFQCCGPCDVCCQYAGFCK